MLEACDDIQRYAAGGRELFDQNELVRVWMYYNIVVLGEAANRIHAIDGTFQDSHPEVPWGDLIGMRNILTHRYDSVDPDEVWGAVAEGVPELRAKLEALLADTTRR